MLGTFSGLMQMILPLCGFSLVMLASYTVSGEPSAWLDGVLPFDPRPSDWLTQGHWLLCLGFLVLNLANRAHGPRFTLAFLVLAWAVIGAVAVYMVRELGAGALPAGPLPPTRVVTAFAVALFLGHVLGVLLFDLTRGARWYTAPLWGAAGGALLFVVLFHAGAHLGTDHPWLARLGVDAVVKLIMAVLMLVPYMALRSAVKPQPGFGGA